jgi:probable HAF family extracellular repeat protein
MFRKSRSLRVEWLEGRRLLAAYSLLDLGFPPGAGSPSSYTYDINDQGQVAGYAVQASLWTPDAANAPTGSMTTLGTLGGWRSGAEAVNDVGQAVGWAQTTSGSAHPALFDNGTVTDLNPEASEGLATDLNDDATLVVGYYLSGPRSAYLWDNRGTEPLFVDLNEVYEEAHGISLNRAVAIQEIGSQVYVLLTSGGTSYVLHDQDGDFTTAESGNLIDLGYLGLGGSTWAEAMNVQGQIVGFADYEGRHGFVIDPETTTNAGGEVTFNWFRDDNQDGANDLMSELSTLGGDWSSRANDIKDLGQIVGVSGNGEPSNENAVIWQNGRIKDLNRLIPRETGWRLVEAVAINNEGQIVGKGESPHTGIDYGYRGCLLTAPTSLPTVSIGDATALEGDAGTTSVHLAITLSEPVPQGDTLTLDYSTVGYFDVTIPDGDFVNSSGSVTFLAGESTKDVVVEVMGDVLAGGGTHDTGDEYFLVNLDNPHNAAGDRAAVFLDAQGTVTILEDEPALYISDVEIAEGNAGLSDLTFTVTVENNTDSTKDDITVYWHTENNTAHDYGDPADGDPDYISVPSDDPAMLVIPAGAPIATFSVPVYGAVVETDQVFVVRLHKGTVENAIIPDLDNRVGGFAYGIIANDDRKDAEQSPPVAVDDAASTLVGSPVTIAVLANDHDPDGDAISIDSFTQGAEGTVVDNGDGTLTYTPVTAAAGSSDTFTYTITDGDPLTANATATVTIDILAAGGERVYTSSDGPLNIGDLKTVTSIIEATFDDPIDAVNVEINFTHAAPETLVISLFSPGGNDPLTLVPSVTSGLYGVDIPAGGIQHIGPWTLQIHDPLKDRQRGTLYGWTLIVNPDAPVLSGATAPTAVDLALAAWGQDDASDDDDTDPLATQTADEMALMLFE